MTGERLKAFISENGYTMASAARLLEMTPQHLNQALNVADVKSGLLEKVCSVFGVSITAIYGETQVMDVDAKQAIYDLTLENTRLKKRIAELEGKKFIVAS